MSSTDAQRRFADLLDLVARDGGVLVTRYGMPHAVVLSIEEYESLVPRRVSESEPRADLDLLTAEFDSLVAKMQTPEAEAAYRALFGASPLELGAAALKFAMTNS
jgi:antitoxin Phd